MISIVESFPSKSKNSLQAEGILWTQFNDINFYVEDIGCENFYLQILKNIFPEIKIKRIFPLGRKVTVIAKAKKSIKYKKRVFIVDLDFDGILEKKCSLKNLFYLKRYSIENYLLDMGAIVEFLKEEKPKLKNQQIAKFKIEEFFKECISIFSTIASNFLIIQKFNLGIPYLSLDPRKDCDTSLPKICLKSGTTSIYYSIIENKLSLSRPRMKYHTQVLKHEKYFRRKNNVVLHVPGKYLISYLKWKLKKIFSISQMTDESFKYRLAKNCEFIDLYDLRDSVLAYTS